MTHIIEYEQYCKDCKFNKQDEDDYPCYECVGTPVKEDGKRPVYWVASDEYRKAHDKTKDKPKTKPIKKGK